MNSWSEDYYAKLEQIRDQIPASDFRFFNLAHLPLMAKKTEELSENCESCKINIRTLDHIADMLPDCLHTPESRKTFEKEKSRIERHLHNAHNVRYANFYYAYYSFLGALAGALVGFAVSMTFLKEININFLLVPGIFGLLAGQIMGKRLDRKKYHDKYQI